MNSFEKTNISINIIEWIRSCKNLIHYFDLKN